MHSCEKDRSIARDIEALLRELPNKKAFVMTYCNIDDDDKINA